MVALPCLSTSIIFAYRQIGAASTIMTPRFNHGYGGGFRRNWRLQLVMRGWDEFSVRIAFEGEVGR